MDIIVTIPKDEAEHFLDDKMDLLNDAFWNLHVRPTALNEGDSIYFVLQGTLHAVATVVKIEEATTECEITGKEWNGCQIWFDDTKILEGEERKPMKGFQGFRYKRKSKEEK